MNKKNFARIGLGLVVLFGILSFFVNLDVFTNFDTDSTIVLQNFIPRGFDTLFSGFSLLGSVEITTLTLLILVIFNRKIESAGVLVLYVIALLVEIAGKTVIDHPNPPFSLLRYDIDFSFPSSFFGTGSSFPSGHSTRTVFLSVLMIFLALRQKKIDTKVKLLISFAILIFLLIMLASRVYLGEHWTSDVIGGMLLGAGFAFLSLIFL